MKYPKEVQENIDVLKQYVNNDKLTTCDIMHLYPGRIAYPDGFYDSRWFTLVCCNTKTEEKRTIEERDGLDFWNLNTEIKMIRIFADGSTIVVFRRPYKFDVSQSVNVGME